MSVPEYVARRVRQDPPADRFVVAGSTPVVSFGDASTACVATLGLNPSRMEFAEHGSWLTGPQRRLATLESLRVRSLADLTDAAVAQVVADCNRYFERNPYWSWFSQLEAVLNKVTNTSYHDGDACHLDLVQWATDPVWGQIPDSQVKKALIEADSVFLEEQLGAENIEVVLVNGSGVSNQLERLGVDLELVDRLDMGIGCDVVVGHDFGSLIVGWSRNLQSSPGVSNALRAAIASSVADVVAERRPAFRESHSPGGAVEQGTAVVGKQALVALLSAWVETCDDERIGDVGNFGGKAWVTCRVGDVDLVLNADTKRSGVLELLAYVHGWGLEDWAVVANIKGTINKVTFGGRAIPGLYLYASEALSGARRI